MNFGPQRWSDLLRRGVCEVLPVRMTRATPNNNSGRNRQCRPRGLEDANLQRVNFGPALVYPHKCSGGLTRSAPLDSLDLQGLE